MPFVRRSPRAALILAAAAIMPAVPAAAEITASSPSGFVSRHEVVVSASPKEVWLALITPSGWWRSEHTWSGSARNLSLTPQAGGCFCERIPEVDEPGRFTLEGSVEHMRVVQAYPERALRMQGALGPLQSEPVTGILTITISTVKEGTRIVWEYNVGGPMRYEVPVIAKAVDGVMGVQIKALAEPLGPVAVAAAPPEEPAPEDTPGKAGTAGPAAGTGPAKAPAPVSVPGPSPAPAGKPSTVDDAFSDLAGDPAGKPKR